MKKKVLGLIILITMVFFVTSSVNAVDDNRTLQDLIDELNVKKNKLAAVNADKTLTDAKINQIKANINQINNDIISIESNIDRLNKEIIKLEGDIVAKDAEVKRIMNQYQLSNGDSAYVEYVMGASTVTDFIFRISIVEQLTSHNEDLIKQMNSMIVESENKTKELATEKINISNRKINLLDEQLKLGDKVEELSEHAISLSEEINDALKTIENYKKIYGCKPSDKIKDCTSVANSKTFVRPTSKGMITNNFGAGVVGIYTRHSAIDIASGLGENIFAAASGNVVFVKQLNIPYLRNALAGKNCTYSPNRWNYPSECSCGGNYVIIQHRVNGVSYATRYLHLNKVNVRVGDKVTPETVIGTMGGAEFYDRCSTGNHLHFEVAKGVYASDFWSFTYSGGAVIDPREVLNFPKLGGSYYGRY